MQLELPKGLQARVPLRVSRLHKRLQAYPRSLLRRLADLNLTEWRTIIVLVTEAPCSATDIMRLTALDRAQISKTLKDLQARGLVSIASAKDGRSRELNLTEAGRRLYDKTEPAMTVRRRALVEGLSKDDLARFFHVTEHLERRMASS